MLKTWNALTSIQGYYGAATGKGRQAAKSELEKLNLGEEKLTIEEGVKAAAKIIYLAHEDSKDMSAMASKFADRDEDEKDDKMEE